MESKNINLRKLSMFILTLLATNSESKIYFLEKCGQPLNTGRIMLTRFKYLARCCSDSDSIEILKALSQSPTRDSKDRQFWYVEHDEDSIKKKKFGMREVKTTILNDLQGPETQEKQPDPIQNVVGIFLTEEDFMVKTPDSRSVSNSVREHSANIKRVRKGSKRSHNNKSMNTENDIFKDKYHTISKPQTQRIVQRSYMKSEVPIKENYRKSKQDRTQEKIKSEKSQTYTSPARFNDSGKVKLSNRFNLNLSSLKRGSYNQTKVTPSTKKTDRQKISATYVNNSLNYKEDSFIDSRKNNKQKAMNGILKEAFSPTTTTDDKRGNKTRLKTGSYLYM